MSQPERYRGRCVLVVDDSMTVRRVVEMVLGKAGCAVHCADSGQRGLELARTVQPDVVLVDFVMPGMYGHVFCKAMREIQGLEQTPIVLISSKSESIGYYFEEIVGVVRQLAKPFESGQLLQVVGEILDALPATRAPVAAAGTPPVPPLEPASGQDAMLEQLTDRIDRLIQQYFRVNLPQVLRSALWNTMREAGLVDQPNMVMSSSLAYLSLPDVLNFIAHAGLSGRLTLIAPELFGEVFVEAGMFVFAKVSHSGDYDFLSDLLLAQLDGDRQRNQALRVIRHAREQNVRIGQQMVASGLISDEQLAHSIEEHGRRALYRMLEVHSGNFYLDATPLPEELHDIKVRLPLISLVMEGLRLHDEKKRGAVAVAVGATSRPPAAAPR